MPFLHFELCYYQAIEWAIGRGLARVEAGAQGQHKIARGYLPTPVYSAHYIADPALRGPVERFLAQERPAWSRRWSGWRRSIRRSDSKSAEDRSPAYASRQASRRRGDRPGAEV